jgi:hypothetical protein
MNKKEKKLGLLYKDMSPSIYLKVRNNPDQDVFDICKALQNNKK